MASLSFYELVATSLGWALLGGHLWVKRHAVADFIAGLEKLRLPRRSSKLGHVDEIAIAKQQAFQEAFRKMRVSHVKSASRCMVPWLMLALLIILVVQGSGVAQKPGDSMQHMSFLFAVMLFLVLSHVIQAGYIEFTPTKLDALVSGLHLFLTMRIFAMTDCLQMFAAFSQNRAVVKIMLGMILLDWKKNLALNCVHFLAQVTKLFIISRSMVLDRFVKMVLGEAVMLALCTTLCHVAEVWMRDLVLAKLEFRTLENSQLAARKLLSVLCDADVMLGPDLKILSSSMKLCHLLMRDSGGCRAMEGLDFRTCIIESDRPRFHDLIANSMMQLDDIGQPVPAVSLHLHLRDSVGLKVPVRVFHVAVPNSDFVEGLSHLIGIKDEGNLYDLSNQASSCQPSQEADVPSTEAFRMLSALMSEPDSESQEDQSSGCSSEDWIGGLDRVVVDVDGLSRKLNMKTATLHFKLGEEHGDSQGLIDYLPSSSQLAVLRNTQNQVNEALQSMSAMEQLYKERVVLCLPTPLGGKICMKCTEFLCSSDTPKEDADRTELPMKLEFQDITRRNSHSRPSGLRGHMSIGTAASSTSRTLPKILEGMTVAVTNTDAE